MSLLKNVAAHSVKPEHLHTLALFCSQNFKKGFFRLKGALVGNQHEHLLLAVLHQFLYSVVYIGGFSRAAFA